MSSEKYLHDQGTIRVFDHEQDKERDFTLTVKDGWGFIGNAKDDTITELRLNKDKLPVSTVKKIFDGKPYVASHEKEEKPSFVDDNNRVHTFVKNNDKFLHEIEDPELAKRYELKDIMENGKSLLSANSYHIEGDNKDGEPLHLVNNETKEVSGDIIPTTNKARASLRAAVENGLVELNVEPGSTLVFAGSLPSGELTDNSKLTLDPGAGANNVKLSNSDIHLGKGQIVDSSFKDSKSFENNDEVEKGTYIYGSSLDNVHLFNNVHISSSNLYYASVDNSGVKSSTLRGGNYTNATIKNADTWLSLNSLVDSSTLHGARLENGHISKPYFEKNKQVMPTQVKDFFDNKHIAEADTLAGNDWYSPTVIAGSKLENVQLLRQGDYGSTINNSTLKNVYVRENISADNSELISDTPVKPLFLGTVAATNNKIHFSDKAVAYNMEKFTTKDGKSGYELPEGLNVSDQDAGKDVHITEYNPEDKAIKGLTKIYHGHYNFKNGDKAFDGMEYVGAVADGYAVVDPVGHDKQPQKPTAKQAEASEPEL